MMSLRGDPNNSERQEEGCLKLLREPNQVQISNKIQLHVMDHLFHLDTYTPTISRVKANTFGLMREHSNELQFA